MDNHAIADSYKRYCQQCPCQPLPFEEYAAVIMSGLAIDANDISLDRAGGAFPTIAKAINYYLEEFGPA